MHNFLKKKAIRLRKKGFSYNLILEKVPVSKSTLSYWLSDVPYSPNEKVVRRVNKSFLKTAITRHKQKLISMDKIKAEALDEFSSISERDLLIFGLGLYLGEGAKLLQRVRIINSDPQVIKFAQLWLEKIFNVPRSNFSLTIHLYPDCDVNKSLKYWSKLTSISLNQFRKPQIDLRLNKSGKKHRKLPYGTANLEVNGRGNKELGIKLFRKVIFFIGAFLKKSANIDREKK
jgi:arsenate reductase-like glutaredoxin family protein